MSQPSLTILLIAASRIARADFAAAGEEPLKVWTGGRVPDSGVEDAVRAALALGGRAGRQVWALCEEVWTQSIDLARGQVSGLSVEQIGRALSFEIEPFSGVPVAESALGFRETDDRDGLKSFWVAEMPRSLQAAIQRIVASAGGRLAGVCHPGGAPRPLQTRTPGWQRLEVWPGALVWLEGRGPNDTHTRVLNAPPPPHPVPEGTILELLVGDALALPAGIDPDLPWERHFLSDLDHLRAWFSAWASCLRDGRPAVPVVTSAPPKPTPHKYYLTAAGLLALVIGLCFLDNWRTGKERDDLKSQQAEITRANQRVDAVRKENAALRQELADLDLQAQKREAVAAHRGAVGSLLRALADHRPEDVVLTGIRPMGGSSHIVTGLALEAVSVDEMSLVLGEALRPAGWVTQLVQKTAKRTRHDGGPWEFSINASPREIPKPSLPATAKRSR